MRQFVRLEVAKDKAAQNVVVEHEIDMVGFSVERQPLLPCHRLWLGDICFPFRDCHDTGQDDLGKGV